MKEIAVYGKGGIGKSTLASNISAALALKGSKVLQIGCDPKHDSTRLLVHGERISTVLDYIRDTAALDQKCEDILFHGFSGTGCIEAGGPKPGVGCAGRGIITAFELLDRFHIKEDYDTIVYDVLGDVVCGGFAVPIRREYANEIFIVTSGEYMSIYAANNILRGISNYDTDTPRIAGLIFNSRNVRGESERVRKFANAVGLPVFAEIPRSEVFAECERQNITAVEAVHQNPDGTTVSRELSETASIFTDIADRIRKGPRHFMAHPLSDEELESLIMGTVFLGNSDAADNETGNAVPGSNTAPDNIADDSTVADSGKANSQPDTLMSKNVIRDEPLHGCAFNGAVCMSIHIKDAIVLMHAPKSCAFISWQTVSSTGRRSLYERGTLLPSSLLPGLDATDMTESDMVFGGTVRLLEKVREITTGKNEKPGQSDKDDRCGRHKAPKALIVISACPAGIIGDDIDRVKELSTPECPVITVKADGNLSGDYLQGMLMAYTELAKQIIDPALKPEPDTVNVVFEKVVTKNAESNFQTMKAFLDRMGIRVNCRFLYDTSFDSVRKFCTSGLNLLAYKDFTGNILEKFFRQNYGSEFLDVQFPVGYEETETWIRKVAEHFGKQEAAESIIAENREKYYSRIRELKPVLEGKKLFIVTFNHELDWILRAALDTGMEIVKIGVLNFSQDEGFRTSIPEIEHVDVVENYDREQRIHDIETLKPDIVLGNYITEKIEHKAIFDTIPMCPDVGFFSGLNLVCRWSGLFKSENEGEWRNDRELFEKYYA